MFWPQRSSLQTSLRCVLCKATVLDLAKCFMLLPVLGVWCLCAYGLDFNPTPGFSHLLKFYILSQAPNREQMALYNLVPTYFCPIPPFYSPLLRRLLQGVGVFKSGSLAPGFFACSEQNGWTAARVCSLSGDMVERLRPAETWPEAAVPPSHVSLASFQSGTRSPWRSLTALRRSLSPVSLCSFFSNSLSRPETPCFASCLGIFFPSLCSYLFCSVWAGRP